MLPSKSKKSKEGVTETEQEYVELQRKYKNFENDRKTYNDETQAKLKKQKNMIDKLQKENQQLKEEINTLKLHPA